MANKRPRPEEIVTKLRQVEGKRSLSPPYDGLLSDLNARLGKWTLEGEAKQFAGPSCATQGSYSLAEGLW